MKSTKKNILVVDDEADICEILQQRLELEGHQVNIALSGKEALTKIKQTRPDIILLDLMMPEMNGFEVARHLFKKNNNESPIPILMLTANASQKDKVKALQLGIDDYLTKPYDDEELLARIEAILRRAQVSEDPLSKRETTKLPYEDEKRLEFLRTLLKHNLKELKPEYDLSTPLGYGLRQAREWLGCEPGEEWDHLDFLSKEQCFEKIFFDQLCLCPFCEHHNLNTRPCCAQCHSAQVYESTIVHHYRCAYQGPESEFLQGLDYFCPKCRRSLNQLGVDYDKPGTLWHCLACQYKSPEPLLESQCRACQKSFTFQDNLKKTLYAYRSTSHIPQILNQGYFLNSSPNKETQAKRGAISVGRFRKKLEEELTRAKTLHRNFILASIEFQDYTSWHEQKGKKIAEEEMDLLGRLLRENLRRIDLLAQNNPNTFIILLPESDDKHYQNTLCELQNKLNEFLKKNLNIQSNFITYPRDGNSTEDLLEALIKTQGQVSF